jgi:ribosomal protein S18 acetylase RimI-like enzyme
MRRKVVYRVLAASELDAVRPLWDMLRRHHVEKSPHFKWRYRELTFDERKLALLEKDELFIDTACLDGSGEMAGYCVSSIVGRGGTIEGEVDSILVAPAYHKLGIGLVLMSRAMAWLEEKGAGPVKVVVAAGNEEVFPFYEAFGFHLFSHVLVRRPPPGAGKKSKGENPDQKTS